MEPGSMQRIAAIAALMLVAAASQAAAAELITVPIDKMRIVRLKGDAHTVVVARPEIVNVVLESPRLLFVYGLQPGETSLHILDNAEKEVFSADLVVAGKTARQVNVHRGNRESTLSCAPHCMPVATPGAAQGGAGGGAAAATPGAPGAAAGPASAAAGLAGGGLAPPPPATPTAPPPAAPGAATGSGSVTTTR
jgi:hypothetical protein